MTAALARWREWREYRRLCRIHEESGYKLTRYQEGLYRRQAKVNVSFRVMGGQP